MDARNSDLNTTVVLGSTNFEWTIDEYDTVKGHSSRCIFCATELQKTEGQTHPVQAKRCTNLDKCIVLLIITLNCKDRVSGATGTNVHFNHFTIEEVGEILFIDLRCDTPNVEATGLPR